MTKRKGIFDVNVNVRELSEKPPSSQPAAPAPELENICAEQNCDGYRRFKCN